MLSRRVEPFPEQLLELSERFSIHTAHHFNVFRRKFERSRFEANVARRIGEHESEVDMDKVALPIEQDVAVMTIFDLQEVGDEGIACEGLCKIPLSTLKLGR